MAFKTVRYRLHTLMRVDRDARATGAGSTPPFGSSEGGGVIRGRTVDRASGNRRVKKRVEAWRYAFVMCEEDEPWRAEDMDEESDEMDVDMMCGEWKNEALSVAVGLIMAV